MSTLEMTVSTASKAKDRVSYSSEIVITKKEYRTEKVTCNVSKDTKDALLKFCAKNGISMSDLGHQLFSDFVKNIK